MVLAFPPELQRRLIKEHDGKLAVVSALRRTELTVRLALARSLAVPPYAGPGDSPMTKVTPFLMFNNQLEAAMAFYTATFPDSEIRNVARNGVDGPVTSAEFVVGGQRFMGYNGGPYFSFSQGFSLYVDCEDQTEVDAYWDKLIEAGATPMQCGWITDPFGVTWQIVPRRFMELIADRNATKVKAVMDAMMEMVKLDVEVLEHAYHNA
jgi:predicted 3-demethylubiquinone-9 3-methyltransferase (glyoxalase superfamily)